MLQKITIRDWRIWNEQYSVIFDGKHNMKCCERSHLVKNKRKEKKETVIGRLAELQKRVRGNDVKYTEVWLATRRWPSGLATFCAPSQRPSSLRESADGRFCSSSSAPVCFHSFSCRSSPHSRTTIEWVEWVTRGSLHTTLYPHWLVPSPSSHSFREIKTLPLFSSLCLTSYTKIIAL